MPGVPAALVARSEDGSPNLNPLPGRLAVPGVGPPEPARVPAAASDSGAAWLPGGVPVVPNTEAFVEMPTTFRFAADVASVAADLEDSDATIQG